MGLINDFKQFLTVKSENKRYAKILSGQAPVFNSYGKNIYAYDIVQNAVNIICTEMMKLNPQHIRIDKKAGLQEVVNSSINRLFDCAPNPYMTTSDFLSKCAYLYETTDNCYIYPTYVIQPLTKDTYKRIYTGFYPLDPSTVEYLEDESGTLFIKFYFLSGYNVTVPYTDIIHWRKNFSVNDIAGGTPYGTNNSFLNLLNADNTAVQGVDKAVKANLIIRGLLKINTLSSPEKQEADIKEFESKIDKSKSGILPMDLKSEFVPITLEPKVIDKDTMTFIEQRILSRYGMSVAIYNGDYTEEDYQSFYEKKLETMIKSLGECFTKSLFTARELDVGNKILCYQQGLIYTSMANKIKTVDILSRVGILTDNQIAGVFGYAPFEGGNVRHTSLNYIDRSIANEYQLSKLKIEEPKLTAEKDYVNDNGEDENAKK